MQSVSNKQSRLAAHLALGLFAACSVQPALAQSEPYIAVEDRVSDPARPMGVIIAQEELATSIELGRIVPNEGGLIGALIDRTPETLAQNAATKAYRAAKPLQEAMAGFSVEPLALAATQQVVSQADWFASSAPQVFTGNSMELTTKSPKASQGDTTVSMTFGIGYIGNEANDTQGALNWNKERNRLVKEFTTANSDANEIAIVSWRYQLSADFTNMQVIADVEMKDPKSGSTSYDQQLISVVKLRRPTFVPEENVAIWAANDGALARKALEMGFARAGEVIPALLALDKDGYDKATNTKKNTRATGANFSGPQLLRDDKGPVFFAKDGDQRLKAFVALQTIRN